MAKSSQLIKRQSGEVSVISYCPEGSDLQVVEGKMGKEVSSESYRHRPEVKGDRKCIAITKIQKYLMKDNNTWGN